MTKRITNRFSPAALAEDYKKALVNDVLSFWLSHGIDSTYGGIYTGLDRAGNIIETDKSMWFQGRALWTFSRAYEMLLSRGEAHGEYMDACRSLSDFIERFGTDKSDGRMYFRVAEDGKPVIKRLRYCFSEAFAAIGFASFSRAAKNAEYGKKAFSYFKNIEAIRKSGALVPKFDEQTRPSRSFGEPMILLNTLCELRLASDEKKSFCEKRIDALLEDIQTYFVRPDLQAVLEQCAPDGSVQSEHFEGRLLNPGHAIEGAWFIMKEGLLRGDEKLKALGVKMFDWMWVRGWDTKYGGIIYFRDIEGKSGNEYWHDMKFWWPQCECAIASLYAYKITGDAAYRKRFVLVHNYFHERFPDTKYGECFGYFHRDGTRSTDIKGNMYKGPFHIPRMYMECMQLLETM